jgi:hypothetical protein
MIYSFHKTPALLNAIAFAVKFRKKYYLITPSFTKLFQC